MSKKKGRYEQCMHSIQSFDDVVIVDLGCRHYGLCHGTAIVSKHTCQYCECLERRSEKGNRNQKRKDNLG